MTSQSWTTAFRPDAQEMREGHKQLYRSLASSVVVVTADAGHGPRGMTASSVIAVSLEPPVMLVSLRHSSGTLAAIRRSRRFALNLLADDQQHLAIRFAGGGSNRQSLSGVDMIGGSPPVLTDVLAAAVCEVRWIRRCGDHTIVLGTIVQHWGGQGAPLVWHQSDYHRVVPGAP